MHTDVAYCQSDVLKVTQQHLLANHVAVSRYDNRQSCYENKR